MSSEFLYYIIYTIALCGGFGLLLCIGDGIFNLLYRFVPCFRKLWDNYCEKLPPLTIMPTESVDCDMIEKHKKERTIK